MSPKYHYIVIPLLLLLVFAGCRKKMPQDRVFNEALTMDGNSKEPFGAWMFKQSINWYSQASMETNNRTFSEWYSSHDANYRRYHHVYIIAAPQIIATDEEIMDMLSFMQQGNTILFATNQLGSAISSTLGMYMDYQFSTPHTWYQHTFRTDTTHRQYRYFFQPFNTSLDLRDSTNINRTLGRNPSKMPDFMAVKYGKGQALFLTNVEALSNYFLLSNNNKTFAEYVIRQLPAEPSSVLWDDFYRRHTIRSDGKNPLTVLLKYPAMRWALALLLLLALLWLITNMVRNRRAVPSYQPNENTTVDFTKSIARLYYNQKDNRNIGLKMIAYLQEYVRQKYYIKTGGFNQEFANILSAKSGLPPQVVQKMVANIHEIQGNTFITDHTLLELNSQIQKLMHGGDTPVNAF